MTLALKPRDRRALLLMAAALGVFLIANFAVLPVVDQASALGGSIPLKEKTLRKYHQVTSLAGARETDWQALQAAVSQAEARLLQARTPALAAAEMQDLVKQLTSQAGIEMRGVDFAPVRELKAGDAAFTAVPVSLAVECGVDQLTNFLASAAGHPKLLAVDQVTITASPRTPQQSKRVAVRLTMHGLMAKS